MRYSHSKYCPECGKRIEIWERFTDNYSFYEAVIENGRVIQCACGRDLSPPNWHTELFTERQLSQTRSHN